MVFHEKLIPSQEMPCTFDELVHYWELVACLDNALSLPVEDCT